MAAELPDVELTGGLLFQLMAAEVAAQRGDLGSAYATYLAVARSSRDPRLARRATELAMAGRANPQALEAAQLWRELAPEARDGRQTHAMLLVANERLAEAEPLLATLLSEAQAPLDDLAAYQRVLIRTKDRAAGFAVFDRLAQPYVQQAGIAAEVHLLVATAASVVELHERAANEARAAVKAKPDEARIVLAASQVLARRGEEQAAAGRAEALELVSSFVQRHVESVEARLAYARLLIADNKLDAARTQFQRVLTLDHDQPEALYAMGVLSLDDRRNRAPARDYFERFLAAAEATPNNRLDVDPAYLNLARIAEDEKRFDLALQWLDRIDAGPQHFTAQLRRALIFGKTQRTDEASALLTELRPITEDQRVQLAATEGQVLREARRFEESYRVLAAALEKSPDNTALLYDAAMAAERIRGYDDMERMLRRLMELKPNDPHAYNALGYTLADRSLRLNEALELITKAHELAPDDAYILDSLGWVHFRLGNLAKAREYLEKAYTARPEAEVGAHLGEVLWALGQKDAARRVWREARAGEPDNETLSSTLARLQVRL